MRSRLVVTTGTLIALMVFLSACGSSSKSDAGAGSTTSASSSPPASADLTCTTFDGKLTLDPPISPTASEAHKFDVTGTLSGCTGTEGITSGDLTLSAEVADPLNCAQLIAYLKPNTANVSIEWNNGKKSTGDAFTVAFDQVTKTTISGDFNGGDTFVGKSATASTSNKADDGGCTDAGVSLSSVTLALAAGTNLTIG